METKTKKVNYVPSNLARCQCGNCPVQSESACAKDKAMAMERTGIDPMPAHEDTPRLYCAAGEATCVDLDYSKNCACPTCQVWRDSELGSYKYCRNGSAEING